MNKEISERDLEFFTRLDVTYRALSLSVQDPVIVPNFDVLTDDPKIIERLPLDITQIYFYVEDYGEDMVKQRINSYPDDIRNSYAIHKDMFQIFQKIEHSAKHENRTEVKNHAQSLCEKLSEYGEFIKKHKENTRIKSFLSFPNYRGGEIVYRSPFIINLPAFNEEKSHNGFLREIGGLYATTDNFPLKGGLEISNVYTGYDSGKGHDGGSYRATIALTKMLLKEHLGFSIE